MVSSDTSYTDTKQKRDNKAGSSYSSVEKTQFDARYHFLWKDIPRLGGKSRKTKAWDGYIGYRYIKYKTPSIVYLQSEDENGDKKMAGESLTQDLVIKEHMGGVGVNNYLRAVSPGFNWIVGVEFYIGKGQTKANLNDYSFNTSYISSEKSNGTIDIITYVPCGSVGFLYNFSSTSVKSSFKLEYKIDMYINNAQNSEKYTVVFGHNYDYFHSLNASFDFLF